MTARTEAPIRTVEIKDGPIDVRLNEDGSSVCLVFASRGDGVRLFRTMSREEAAAFSRRLAELAADDRIYPCADCGIMRSKAEGGTVFTVCDACWNKHYGKDDKLAAAENQLAREQAERIEVLEALLAERTVERDGWESNYNRVTADRDRLLAEVERMRGAMLSFVETVEHADRCMAARGKGGQQVPYTDDFASAVPSVMSRLKWWARYFRTSIDSALATSAQDGGKGEGR